MSEVRPTEGKTFLTAGRHKVAGAGTYYSPSAKRVFLLLWTWGSRGPAAFLWLLLSGWTWCTPGSVPPGFLGLGTGIITFSPFLTTQACVHQGFCGGRIRPDRMMLTGTRHQNQEVEQAVLASSCPQGCVTADLPADWGHETINSLQSSASWSWDCHLQPWVLNNTRTKVYWVLTTPGVSLVEKTYPTDKTLCVASSRKKKAASVFFR